MRQNRGTKCSHCSSNEKKCLMELNNVFIKRVVQPKIKLALLLWLRSAEEIETEVSQVLNKKAAWKYHKSHPIDFKYWDFWSLRCEEQTKLILLFTDNPLVNCCKPSQLISFKKRFWNWFWKCMFCELDQPIHQKDLTEWFIHKQSLDWPPNFQWIMTFVLEDCSTWLIYCAFMCFLCVEDTYWENVYLEYPILLWIKKIHLPNV